MYICILKMLILVESFIKVGKVTFCSFFNYRQLSQKLKGQKKVKFGYFATSWQFYFCICVAYKLLGDDIVQLSRDLMELFEKSFSRSERSDLAHFPINIDIIQ